METEIVKISKVKNNPNNPRLLKDDKFEKLVKSIQEFPQMMRIRPIVVNDDMIVLGGNMRLRACKDAGLKEVPIIKASELTEEQQREFIIKDNVGYGEWDWDLLANEWNTEELDDWGLNTPFFADDMSNQKNYAGLNADLEYENFLNADIKRFYLAYDNDTFAKVVDWFNEKQELLDAEDFSETMLKIIELDTDRSEENK